MRICNILVLLVIIAGCNTSDRAGPLKQRTDDNQPAENKLADIESVKKEIKSLLPMAASMSRQDLERLARAVSIPTVDHMDNQSLTALVLVLNPNHLDLSREDFEKEFHWHSRPDPAALIDALTQTPGMASVSQPGSVKSLSCQVHGDRAEGTAEIELKGFLDMQVNYVAMHDGQSWKVTTFELPNCQAKTELQADGKWKASGLGVRPVLPLSLPTVDVVADREEVPHRRVIYIGRDEGKHERVAIENEVFEPDQLEQKLELFYVGYSGQVGEESRLAPEDVNLVIRADAKVEAGVVVQVLERCIAAGIRDFRFQVIKQAPSEFTSLHLLGEIVVTYKEEPVGGREFSPLTIRIIANDSGGIEQLLLVQQPFKDVEALSMRLHEYLGSVTTKDEIEVSFRIEVDYDLRYEELAKVLAACSYCLNPKGKARIRPFLWDLSREELEPIEIEDIEKERPIDP